MHMGAFLVADVSCKKISTFQIGLDNTGAWVIEVYPSLLCNRMPENVDLYIKLKLGFFFFI